MPIGIKGLTINIGRLGGKRVSLRIFAFLLVLVLLLLVGVFSYRTKLSQIDWRFLLGKLAIERPAEEGAIPEVKEKPVAEEEILVATPGKVYEKTAQPGEGITHLARRALKSYLEEKGADLNLTPEHKIYIEDYIKDRTGERWLMLGETLTFSEELIVEAINESLQLTPDQLENLKQYSQLISSF